METEFTREEKRLELLQTIADEWEYALRHAKSLGEYNNLAISNDYLKNYLDKQGILPASQFDELEDKDWDFIIQSMAEVPPPMDE